MAAVVNATPVIAVLPPKVEAGNLVEVHWKGTETECRAHVKVTCVEASGYFRGTVMWIDPTTCKNLPNIVVGGPLLCDPRWAVRIVKQN